MMSGGFDLSAGAMKASAEAGLKVAASAAGAVEGADIVITMLPAGKHVLDAYSGSMNLLGAAKKGALFIDCSTIDIASARAASTGGGTSRDALVDAPVSGGVGGAAGATLTFMVGGEDAAFALAKPILRAMGKKIVHCGGPGTGQAAKICNNMILGISMIGVGEAFVLAKKLGLSDAGAVRCRLDLLGFLLVAQHLLSRARSGADLAGEPRLRSRVLRSI